MMKLKPRALLCLILVGLLVQGPLAPLAQAQNPGLENLFEDDLDEPLGGFQPPPPPPPTNPTDFSTSPPPPGFPSDPPAGSGGDFGGSSGGGSRKFPTVQGTGNGSNANAKPGGTSAKGPDSGKPGLANAQIEDITNENYPDLIESFDYPNAEIADIVKAISQLTGKNFIIDTAVRGKISIVAPTQITVAEAYKAFLSALAMNGFTIVPSGRFLKIMSARNAQRSSIETYSGQYYPNADVMITRIVHLKHTSAEEVNKRLRILPSKDGEMTPYEPTNSLIISDYGTNVERIMKIINELDRPGFEEQLAVVQIRYAKAKDVADLVNQIINKSPTRGAQGGMGQPGGFGAGVPSFRAPRAPGAGGASEELSLVAPDERTNAIIVVGNKAGIEKVRSLVKKLDYRLDPAEAGGVFVYYVKYGEAEKIAGTLNQVAQGGGAGGAAAGGGFGGAGGGFGAPVRSPLNTQTVFGGDVKIGFDKNTNSLVITASKQDYEVVQTLLEKLDIPRDQVYVEAIIMEMNANKQKEWNPIYYYLDPASGGVGRMGFSKGGNLLGLLNPASDSGAVLGFGSGQKFNFQVPGQQPIPVTSLLAFIKLIQSNTEANILATPQILALDNEEATVEVGDRVPTRINRTNTAAGISTAEAQLENASIKLKLTPFIRPDSSVVRMKLEQSIKRPASVANLPAELRDSTFPLSERSINTNIVVNSGDTAVLGGLVRDEETFNETKIPILGDIPVLGWLFKASEKRMNKINLMVFLTPKIIKSKEDGHKLLSKKTNERIEWLKRNFDGRDPYGKTIDSLPRAARGDNTISSDEPITSRKTNKPIKRQ